MYASVRNAQKESEDIYKPVKLTIPMDFVTDHFFFPHYVFLTSVSFAHPTCIALIIRKK